MQITFDEKKKLDTNPIFSLFVQGENLAESIQIKGPKVLGALDLSQLRMAVRVTSPQYETTVEKTLEQTADEDTITLTWNVDKQFTGSPGPVQVMLVGYGGNEEVIKITSSGITVKEDQTFGAAPPESTWEQILQQMQGFATQAYESKTAAENSAAAAADSQKVAEEKAAQATNAAGTAVAAAGTAAADAAAQAAAKTEQQIRQYADDRYARPLVTKTGPAANLEVYPDKQSNLKVYANGFTTQAGSGDPSLTNVRALTNGGLKLVAVTFATGDNFTASGSNNYYRYDVVLQAPPVSAGTNRIWATYLQEKDEDSLYAGQVGVGINSNGKIVVTLPAGLTPANYFPTHPLTVWYVPADESQATGLYAPIPIQGGEYRANCLELTAPLCEGDSVVSWIESGCDCVAVFDGSEDENWGADLTFGKRYQIFGKISPNVVPYSKVYANQYKAIAYLPTWSTYDYNNPIVAVNKNNVYVAWNGINSLEDLKTMLQKTPLVIYYRSANYTEAADIPVSLESHAQRVVVADGTTNALTQGSGGYALALPGAANGAVKCDTFNNLTAASGSVTIPASQFPSSVTSLETANQWLQSNNVTFVYPVSTTIVYAHPAVVLPALPDDDGKVTITGQSGGTVTVVFNKSIIKEIAEIKAAMLAMGAQLSL